MTDPSSSYYYPDIVVTCDERDRQPQSQFIEHPVLIIEVLSPRTAVFDRTIKFADYRTIPSLREYLLVSTDRQQVEHFQRDDRGQWHLVPAADPIHFASLDYTVAIADIYEDTDIPA